MIVTRDQIHKALLGIKVPSDIDIQAMMLTPDEKQALKLLPGLRVDIHDSDNNMLDIVGQMYSAQTSERSCFDTQDRVVILLRCVEKGIRIDPVHAQVLVANEASFPDKGTPETNQQRVLSCNLIANNLCANVKKYMQGELNTQHVEALRNGEILLQWMASKHVVAAHGYQCVRKTLDQIDSYHKGACNQGEAVSQIIVALKALHSALEADLPAQAVVKRACSTSRALKYVKAQALRQLKQALVVIQHKCLGLSIDTQLVSESLTVTSSVETIDITGSTSSVTTDGQTVRLRGTVNIDENKRITLEVGPPYECDTEFQHMDVNSAGKVEIWMGQLDSTHVQKITLTHGKRVYKLPHNTPTPRTDNCARDPPDVSEDTTTTDKLSIFAMLVLFMLNIGSMLAFPYWYLARLYASFSSKTGASVSARQGSRKSRHARADIDGGTKRQSRRTARSTRSTEEESALAQGTPRAIQARRARI